MNVRVTAASCLLIAACANVPSELRVAPLGLRLLDGEAARHWLLHVRVDEVLATDRGDAAAPQPLPPVTWQIKVNGEVQPFESRLLRATVTVADGADAVLGRSQPLLSRDFLGKGSCRRAAAPNWRCPINGRWSRRWCA